MAQTSIQTKNNILTLIQAHQDEIKTFGVKKLGLFGSFSHSQQHSESDIDLLVEFEPGQKTFDNFIQLSFLLEDILEHPVELVTVESLSPYIAPYITQEVEYVIST